MLLQSNIDFRMDKEVQKLITLKPRVLSTFSLCIATFSKANRELKENEPKPFSLELRVKLDLPVNLRRGVCVAFCPF